MCFGLMDGKYNCFCLDNQRGWKFYSSRFLILFRKIDLIFLNENMNYMKEIGFIGYFKRQCYNKLKIKFFYI